MLSSVHLPPQGYFRGINSEAPKQVLIKQIRNEMDFACGESQLKAAERLRKEPFLGIRRAGFVSICYINRAVKFRRDKFIVFSEDIFFWQRKI